ncbi:MAG: hypothetical protein A3K06_03135 [Candidatus Doudnabacteria bacterium RIFCSPHIGHO2_01_52_17]|uniref:Uncharacterized protein n=1 Tax=Candidatus Doudnabacteria bacterium RIFCSPHIGHO2_01_52_17 TaxID=1817820 RepID=A0A1F5NCE4_9BACT|nr:MAG: hypothetical protein UY73_C0009G0003 [Parcubacteria group bacterium GW2011_GWA2_52_8]OGE75258.1 MAG: hypothetical protein A3K06_03135 [Candidatus Doudnabacteria bacterium RIFCSPHIGHO2_01_52_17]
MSTGPVGIKAREDEVDQFLSEAVRLQAHLEARAFANYRNLRELTEIIGQNEVSRADARRLLKLQQYPALSTDAGIVWLLENASLLC